jgi:hypothetical protein
MNESFRKAARDKILASLSDADYLESTGGPMSIVHAIRRDADRIFEVVAWLIYQEDRPTSISLTSLDDDWEPPYSPVLATMRNEEAWEDIA